MTRRSPSSVPADQRTVRRHNSLLVLQQVTDRGPISRAQISAATGLHRSTVSSIAAELIERRLIVDTGVERDGSNGRPGFRLEVNPRGALALGLEVAADYIAAYGLDLTGKPVYQAFVYQDNTARSPRDVLTELRDLVAGLLAEFRPTNGPILATLAVPGLTERGSGRLLYAPHLHWTDEPLAAIWRDLAETVPVDVDNEANLAAYAEMKRRSAQQLSTFCYVSGGIGMGLGIVLDGHLYRGSHGFAGEFGHITLSFRPTDDRETLEGLAGQTALLVKSGINTTDLAGRGEPNRVGAALARRARQRDSDVLDSLHFLAVVLGRALANLTNILDLEAVVLGGNLSPLGEWLEPIIQEEIGARSPASGWTRCEVHFSELGREAAVLGAAQWSLQQIRDSLGDIRHRRPAATGFASVAT